MNKTSKSIVSSLLVIALVVVAFLTIIPVVVEVGILRRKFPVTSKPLDALTNYINKFSRNS